MPEHAEVRVAAAQLHAVVAGRILDSLVVRHPRTTRSQPVEELDRFVSRRVTGVYATGKWIVVRFGDDDALGIHLRMSGRIVLDPGLEADRHVHALLAFGGRDDALGVAPGVPPAPKSATACGPDPVVVGFRDPRTFGELRVLTTGTPPGAPDLFSPEITWRVLYDACGSASTIKTVLLDQRALLSGIGSYLADETLHAAEIDPRRPAYQLSPVEWPRVLDSARDIAADSAVLGGVTLADEGWLDLWGRPGRYGDKLRVHARTTCATCGEVTMTEVLAGRRARWCPECQPDLRLS